MVRALVLIIIALVTAYLGAFAFGVVFVNAVTYRPHARVAEPARADVTVVRIATEDGETLRAWWRPPDGDAPVLLFFGGNADRPELLDGRWRRIAEHGEGFLAVSYRGYSGSTGRPSEGGLHADARAAYDWLMAQGVAPDALVIHGFSLGSGPATRLAAERAARAVVLEAPFLAIDDIARDRAPIFPWRPFVRSRFPNRDWISRIEAPLLVVHGEADKVIPVSHGARLAALARGPARFIAMPGSDHATLTRDGLYDHVWEFLADLEDLCAEAC